MSPSTVMRLKLCRDGFVSAICKNFRVNRRIRRDETKHRRVQSAVRQRRRTAPVATFRLNHARAFADAANANHFSAEQNSTAICFGPRIAGQ